MFFVVDETSLDFNKVGADKCIESLEILLDNLDEAIDSGYNTCYSGELFHTCVWDEMCLYDLYVETSPVIIPHEVQERIAVIFNRMPQWEDLQEEWPTSFDVEINGSAKEEAPSIAWAHKRTRESLNGAVGCFVFAGGRNSGKMDVKINEDITTLWFIEALEQHKLFFRWIIANKTKNHQELQNYIAPAFPSIDFVDDCLAGIKDMSKKYTEIIDDIVIHLGVLSDYGNDIFEGDWQKATYEFGSRGINVTDENGKTKQNKKAKKERTICISGQEIVFWWHSKIERDRDRIHFCPNGLGKGQILVGIFHRHLPI